MNLNRLMMHKNLSATVLPGIMGSLFIASALLKLHAFKTFQGEVRLYLEAYFPTVFIGHERFLAASTCIIELIMGLCAVTGVKRKKLSILYGVVLLFFVWLTGINLFFPSLMGSIESCGCFGELVHFTPESSFLKSVLLWFVSIVWMFLEYYKDEQNAISDNSLL